MLNYSVCQRLLTLMWHRGVLHCQQSNSLSAYKDHLHNLRIVTAVFPPNTTLVDVSYLASASKLFGFPAKLFGFILNLWLSRTPRKQGCYVLTCTTFENSSYTRFFRCAAMLDKSLNSHVTIRLPLRCESRMCRRVAVCLFFKTNFIERLNSQT